MTHLNKIIATMVSTVLISGISAAADLSGMATESEKTPTQEAKTYDTVDEILQSNGTVKPHADRKVLMSNGTEKLKAILIRQENDNEIANNAIVVPALNAEAITTVACPVGTSAQPDMTCLITGNFKLDAQP